MTSTNNDQLLTFRKVSFIFKCPLERELTNIRTPDLQNRFKFQYYHLTSFEIIRLSTDHK